MQEGELVRLIRKMARGSGLRVMMRMKVINVTRLQLPPAVALVGVCSRRTLRLPAIEECVPIDV